MQDDVADHLHNFAQVVVFPLARLPFGSQVTASLTARTADGAQLGAVAHWSFTTRPASDQSIFFSTPMVARNASDVTVSTTLSAYDSEALLGGVTVALEQADDPTSNLTTWTELARAVTAANGTVSLTYPVPGSASFRLHALAAPSSDPKLPGSLAAFSSWVNVPAPDDGGLAAITHLDIVDLVMSSASATVIGALYSEVGDRTVAPPPGG